MFTARRNRPSLPTQSLLSGTQTKCHASVINSASSESRALLNLSSHSEFRKQFVVYFFQPEIFILLHAYIPAFILVTIINSVVSSKLQMAPTYVKNIFIIIALMHMLHDIRYDMFLGIYSLIIQIRMFYLSIIFCKYFFGHIFFRIAIMDMHIIFTSMKFLSHQTIDKS